MIHLSYNLLEEEAVRYYEMILRSTKETLVPRVSSMMWGPALAIVLMMIFKDYTTTSILSWFIAVSFSIIWILVISPIIYRNVCHTIAKKKVVENKTSLRTINIQEENGIVTVNNDVKIPQTYFVYYDLLVIVFSDNTNLIVPERVFDKDEKLMEKLINDIATYIKKNEIKEVQVD